MCIIFGALMPHPPLIMPAIGKEHTKKFRKTLRSFKQLEQDFYASKPDTLILLSPHGKIMKDAYSINLCAKYVGTFEEFGDFSTRIEIKGDVMSIQHIRAAAEVENKYSLIMTSDEKIDYGVSIPHFFLTQHLSGTGIIPLSPSEKSLAEHFEFGKFLKRAIVRINKRFSIVASGDLSHRLTKNSPGGYSKNAVNFNKRVMQYLEKCDIESFLHFPPDEIQDAAECSLKVIAMLLGIFHETDKQVELLSYEYPFGVGYLTAEVTLS